MTDDANAFYRLVASRRDVRGEYLPDPVPADVLARLLGAAHRAPSVGYSQPWNFILVNNAEKRRAVFREFEASRRREAEQFDGERRTRYDRLKLEGIMTAPVNLLVTCDRSRFGPAVLGRTQQPDTDIYSTVCAIQNLWLAARCEGLGLGWVSILRPASLKALFDLPEPVEPIAYLCLGYVSHFYPTPELEQRGWNRRLPLAELVFQDDWGEQTTDVALVQAIDDLSQKAAE